MYPFLFNPIFPFGPFRRRFEIPTLDRRGIYEVCTTGVVETTEQATNTVDFGINPCVWNRLPNESVILWKVRHPISTTAAAYPVTVVTPTNGSSTVSNGSTPTSGSKIPVVDNKGTQALGQHVTNTDTPTTTEHLVYINKSAGIFRLLGVEATATTPAS